ncbi:MAG: hypothetical protein R3F19_34630 [Verrucomicrobiales bacterium]
MKKTICERTWIKLLALCGCGFVVCNGARPAPGSIIATELIVKNCKDSTSVFIPESTVFRPGEGKVPFPIDIDGDGNVELSIDFSPVIVAIPESGVEIYVRKTPTFVGDRITIQGMNEVRNFQFNESIGPDTDAEGEQLMWIPSPDEEGGLQINGRSAQDGEVSGPGLFVGDADDFIGVRFLRDGHVHYGWVQVDSVGEQDFAFAVYGWAYESEPETAIPGGALPPTDDPLEIVCTEILKMDAEYDGMQLRYTRAGIVWHGAKIGRKYVVEASPDCETWEVVTDEIEAVREQVVGTAYLPYYEHHYFRVRELVE